MKTIKFHAYLIFKHCESRTFNVSSTSQTGTFNIKVDIRGVQDNKNVIVSDTQPRTIVVNNQSQQPIVEQSSIPSIGSGNVVLSRPSIVSKPTPTTTIVSSNQSPTTTTVYSPAMARILVNRNRR